jgi:ferredoxin
VHQFLLCCRRRIADAAELMTLESRFVKGEWTQQFAQTIALFRVHITVAAASDCKKKCTLCAFCYAHTRRRRKHNVWLSIKCIRMHITCPLRCYNINITINSLLYTYMGKRTILRQQKRVTATRLLLFYYHLRVLCLWENTV